MPKKQSGMAQDWTQNRAVPPRCRPNKNSVMYQLSYWAIPRKEFLIVLKSQNFVPDMTTAETKDKNVFGFRLKDIIWFWFNHLLAVNNYFWNLILTIVPLFTARRWLNQNQIISLRWNLNMFLCFVSGKYIDPNSKSVFGYLLLP